MDSKEVDWELMTQTSPESGESDSVTLTLAITRMRLHSRGPLPERDPSCQHYCTVSAGGEIEELYETRRVAAPLGEPSWMEEATITSYVEGDNLNFCVWRQNESCEEKPEIIGRACID